MFRSDEGVKCFSDWYIYNSVWFEIYKINPLTPLPTPSSPLTTTTYDLIVLTMGASQKFCSIWLHCTVYIQYRASKPHSPAPVVWSRCNIYWMVYWECCYITLRNRTGSNVNGIFSTDHPLKIDPKSCYFSTVTHIFDGLPVPYSTLKMKPGSIFNVGQLWTLHRSNIDFLLTGQHCAAWEHFNCWTFYYIKLYRDFVGILLYK